MVPLHVILYGIAASIIGGGLIKAAVFYIVKPIKEAAERIASVSVIEAKLDTLRCVAEEQSSHIIKTEESMVPLIRSVRSIGYAMKEHGWNGSTNKILEHANEAEDILREASRESCEEAMRT